MPINIAALFTGSEILRGQTQNSNLSSLGQSLTENGYQLIEERSAPDELEKLTFHIRELSAKYNILFICGGLGPTNDDLTLEAISNATNTPLIYSEKEAQKIKKRLTKKMPQSYFDKQCLCLKEATIIENTIGLAPAFELFLDTDRVIYVLPGPPREFNPISRNIIKRIQKKLPNNFYTRTSYIYGLSETIIENRTKHYQKQYPQIDFAYCASIHLVKLTLSGYKTQQKNIDLLYKQIFQEFKKHAFSHEFINETLHELLLRKQLSLSIAESCTGGLVAQIISQTPSSSQYFLGALIAYNNTVKHRQLAVKQETLEKYGAVSEQTVEEMLVSCQKIFNSNISIAISGVAGPQESENKPRGLVFIGIAIDNKRIVKEYKFSKAPRINIQKKASYEAIRLLVNELKVL